MSKKLKSLIWGRLTPLKQIGGRRNVEEVFRARKCNENNLSINLQSGADFVDRLTLTGFDNAL